MTQLYFLKTWLQSRYTDDERGANLVEYVLLLALIALAVVGAVIFIGGILGDRLEEAGSTISGID